MSTATLGLGNASPVRNAKIEASNRGKTGSFNDALDFCRVGLNNMGEEMVNDVRVELQHTSEQIKSEVAEILDERQKKIDAKMDSIFQKVQYMSMAMAADSAKHDQAEANRKLSQRRDEQIGQITDAIQLLREEVAQVQKKSDMADMARSLTTAMDLPKLIDTQLMDFFQQFTEMQQNQKRNSAETAASLDEVKRRLNENLEVDFSPVMKEVAKCQNIMDDEFQLLVGEIARIQQGLHLDYPLVSKQHTMKPPKTSDTLAVSVIQHGSQRAANSRPSSRADNIAESSEDFAIPRESLQSESERGRSDVAQVAQRASVVYGRASFHGRLRRVREFWSQTEDDRVEQWAQTDPDMQKTQKKRRFGLSQRDKPKPAQKKTNLADKDAMREKARLALMRPQYNVFDHYHETGIFQRIARSPYFDSITIALVCLNAIWIAIEIDNNDASMLLDAPLYIIVVEMTFCTYFFFEVVIRFFAFKRKVAAFKDFWFAFDFILVFNMVVETWIIPIIFTILPGGGSMPNLSMLRMVRMVKLLRLSRIARILRSIPELVIIVKAIGFAARSVAVFLLLWLVIIYLFAVVMRQLTSSSDDPAAKKYFPDVPSAMVSLLLDGILADYAPFIHAMGINPLWWFLLLCFVLLSSVTIMYMLVGVLVEVVGVIASSEKEGMTVSFVAQRLREKMDMMGHSPDAPITKYAMQNIICEPEICQMLLAVNVDVVVLMDSLEMQYEDLAKQGGDMTFEKMVDLVLNGRGSNFATVRDTKEVLRILKALVSASTSQIEKKLSEELSVISGSLNMLHEEAADRAGDSGMEIMDEFEEGTEMMLMEDVEIPDEVEAAERPAELN